MSINWVMLKSATSTGPPFTPLPDEHTLTTSPPRVSLQLSSLSASGKIYLTNQRLVFLPEKPIPELQSFSAPILSLHDSHVAAPWFGPNVWIALLQPTRGGGIATPATGVVEVKFTFKDGGAFDFQTQYERVRERLQQAVEASRMGARVAVGGTSRAGAAMNGVDVSNVNLDELPVYQERSDGPLLSPLASSGVVAQPSRGVQSATVREEDDRARSRPPNDTPSDPPPGYEEAQMAGLQDEAERRQHEVRPDE